MLNISQKIAAIKSLEEDLKNLGLEGVPISDDVGTLNEPLVEGFRRTPRKSKTKKTTARARLQWKRAKRRPGARAKARRYRRKPMVRKRTKLARQWRARRRIPSKRPGRGGRIRLMLAQGMDRVSNLMEEVQEIVSGIEKSNQEEMIKAYANAALVADTLSTQFLDMAEAIAEGLDEENAPQDEVEAVEGLVGLSEQFEAIAEEAAESAEALRDCADRKVFAEEVNVDEVEEHFKEMMSAILDGCDIYAGLTEEDEDEKEKDDEKDKKDDEKEEKKDEKKEEAVVGESVGRLRRK